MPRPGRALVAGLAAVALVLSGAVAPAAAQSAEDAEVVVRDALVVDVVNSSSSSSAHHRYDSAAGPAPVARASSVPGGVLLARPAAATTGPSVEVLPSDAAPLAVGTVTGVRGKWSTGSLRPVPVVRLIPGTGFLACTEFQSTPSSSELVVHDVVHDGAGTVVLLSASWRIPCSNTGAVATGEIRYRSAAHYASASSSSTTLGRVLAGSRTPFSARIVNTGSVPLELGPPAAVDRGPSAPRLEVAAGGQDCTSAPLPVGSHCTLSLEYVDDGLAGGGYLAELRLAAPQLVRGHVSVQAAVQEVVWLPAPVSGLRSTAAYDGIALAWNHASSPTPDGWRIRRVDGGATVEVATLPWHTVSFVDTSLAKGESATYEVSAYNAAGEAAPGRVAVARQDRPDPPAAVERRTLSMEELAGARVADTAAGTAVQVSDIFLATTAVTGGGMTLHLPRLPGPGTFAVGSGPDELPVLAYGPETTCGSTTGAAEVREAWVRADGTVHRLDADLHLQCAGTRIEVVLRLGTDGPFAAVTTTPRTVTDLQAVVGEQPASRVVRVDNVGSEPVAVGAPVVSGADADAFSVAASTCGSSLAAGRSCALDVRFAPARSGDHRASLALPVGTALGARRVPLQGAATGPPHVRVPQVTGVLGRALLTWSAGPDGGSPVTGTQVQRADGDGPFAPVADLAADAFSWVDPDVRPGAVHRYRLLTQNPYGSVEPTDAQVVEVVGADEELLAAVSTSDDGPVDLMSLRVAEGQPVPVPTGHDVDLPTVSPDGRTVAYVSVDEDGDAGLWLQPVEGGAAAARLLVDAADVDETDPAWRPDGSAVCYSRLTDTEADVWCVGTAVGAVPAAFAGGTDAVEPSWLPDGSALIATDLAAETTSLVRITRAGGRSTVRGTAEGRWPAVSPRGDRLAFVVTDEAGLDHLRTVPVAGGTPTDLATTIDLYERPSWAPDGQALAVPTISPWQAAEVTVWTAARGATPASVVKHRAAAGHDVLAVAWRRQDRAAPVVSFPGAPLRTAAGVRLPVRVVDDTAPVAAVGVSCALDGRAVERCAAGWTGTLAPGTHRLTVTATDPHGRTSTAEHTFVVDTAAPVVGLSRLPAFSLAGSVDVAYGASDPSGVASYDIRYRSVAWNGTGFSAMTVPAGWASTTARSRSLALVPGREYCVSVRARDRVGNLSAWSAEQCTAAPLDDRALARATSGWASATSSTALSGTLTRTSVAGSRLARTSAHARRLAVVATTCPSCGAVDVLVGATRIGSLSLVSSTTRPRQVLMLPLQAGVRSGTVTLRSTRSGRPVIVDGLGLRRT